LDDGVDLDTIADQTHGFVGADMQSLTTEAAMHALRRAGEEPVITRPDFEAALAAVDPSAMREHVAESPTITYEDVGGLAQQKETLTESVEWPLEYGPLFNAADTDPPTGVLLYGPPGTGKTLLARAVAGESGVNFIHVNGPELLDQYVGESEQAVRDVFDRARQTAPSIVFLDEIDAVASHRGEGHEVTERVVSQLLTELDGVTDNPNLVVIAATNRRDALDDALLRPGRLETHIAVPEPDEDAREAILAVHTAEKPLGDAISVAKLAKETAGFSGAELAALVRRAAMMAIRDVAGEIEPAAAADYTDDVVLEQRHVTAALDRVSTGQ
jgi:transitional endoplasmic reticulum ATPase